MVPRMSDVDRDGGQKSPQDGDDDGVDDEKRLFNEPGMRAEDIEYVQMSSSSASSASSTEGASESALPKGRIAELPLFPLGMVLYPGANVPLHIFEMRYRRMFNVIRETDNMFGIVMYDSKKQRMASIGCSAECVKFQPLEDGRILVVNQGKQRFRVLRVLKDTPYTTALVEYINDETPNEDPSELAVGVWTGLQEVLRLSNKLYSKSLALSDALKDLAPSTERTQGENTESRFRSLESFSFGVSAILDMPVVEQQILLQTQSLSKRLGKQKELLDFATQQLAAQISIKSALGDTKKD